MLKFRLDYIERFGRRAYWYIYKKKMIWVSSEMRNIRNGDNRISVKCRQEAEGEDTETVVIIGSSLIFVAG